MLPAGVVQSKLVLDLDNGLKVGLLGLIGEDADDSVPSAAPLSPSTTTNPSYRAWSTIWRTTSRSTWSCSCLTPVLLLRPMEGRSSSWLRLNGVDVICSGHSHIAAPNAIESNGAVIVQPGYFGMWLGRLDLRFNVTQKRVESYEYEMITVDDTIAGDASIQAVVDEAVSGIDSQLEAALGLTTITPVAELDFELARQELRRDWAGQLHGRCVPNLGDPGRSEFQRSYAPLPLLSFPNGIVRDDMHASQADGVVTFSDLYNIMPLGMSPDSENQQAPGWPLVSIYATAGELRAIAEVPVSLAALSQDAFLNLSGIRFVADSSLPMLQRVTEVFLCDNSLPVSSGGDR